MGVQFGILFLLGMLMFDEGFREGWRRTWRLKFVHLFPEDDKVIGFILVPVYVDIPASIWCGNKYGHIIRLNTHLTFQIKLTNKINIDGVFNSFYWFTVWSDSKWHFQGLKWGFTLYFLLQWFNFKELMLSHNFYQHMNILTRFNFMCIC